MNAHILLKLTVLQLAELKSKETLLNLTPSASSITLTVPLGAAASAIVNWASKFRSERDKFGGLKTSMAGLSSRHDTAKDGENDFGTGTARPKTEPLNANTAMAAAATVVV